MGVTDKEFLIRRSRQELKEITESAGMGPFDDFDALFDKAQGLFGDDMDLVSLDAILYLQGLEIENRVEKKMRGS